MARIAGVERFADSALRSPVSAFPVRSGIELLPDGAVAGAIGLNAANGWVMWKYAKGSLIGRPILPRRFITMGMCS